MTLWRERLETSLKSTVQEPDSHFFQLATIDNFGVPHNRTVVYRRPAENGSDTSVYFVTDVRSQKWLHLTGNARAAVSWYFASQREQYRFNCYARLHGGNKNPLTEELWDTLSPETKRQFHQHPPGLPMHAQEERRSASGSNEQVPGTFGVVELTPDSVDYLSLRLQPHYRENHRRNTKGEWEVQQVHP